MLFASGDEVFPKFWTIYAKCPQCKSDNVVVETEGGYFWVDECKSCGYVSKNII